MVRSSIRYLRRNYHVRHARARPNKERLVFFLINAIFSPSPAPPVKCHTPIDSPPPPIHPTCWESPFPPSGLLHRGGTYQFCFPPLYYVVRVLLSFEFYSS